MIKDYSKTHYNYHCDLDPTSRYNAPKKPCPISIFSVGSLKIGQDFLGFSMLSVQNVFNFHSIPIYYKNGQDFFGIQ